MFVVFRVDSYNCAVERTLRPGYTRITKMYTIYNAPTLGRRDFKTGKFTVNLVGVVVYVRTVQ